MKQVTIPAQWLQELIALCGPEDHELRERVMKSAAPAPVDALATGGQAQAVEQAPVLYVSKGQLDNHRDPDGPDSANAGRYLPARITPAGNFTMPLFAAPQAQADARDAGNEWQEIGTLPTCDDPIWLYCQENNTIDGPIAPDPSFEEMGWTHWAYANAPSTAVIDRAAIAAAKGE